MLATCAALERCGVLGGQLLGVRRAAASTARKRLLVDGEYGDDAAVYVVSDPNKPGRRVYWRSLLKGVFVVTVCAFTDPADVRGPVTKYLPATSPARAVHKTEAFAAKHAEIATHPAGHLPLMEL